MKFKIKQQNIKRNQVTAIHIIAALLLIVMGFITLVTPFSLNIFLAGKDNTNEVPFTWVNIIGGIFSLIGIIILIISIFFNKKYLQKRNNLIIRIVEIICFSLILIYCIVQKWYLPVAYSAIALVGIILAYFLENMKYRESHIVISNEGVILESNIKKTMWKWEEINHTVLKHNVLSIHTLEEKMYQFILDEKPNDQDKIQEKIKTYLEESKSKRKNNQW